jgi:hypothetical protein
MAGLTMTRTPGPARAEDPVVPPMKGVTWGGLLRSAGPLMRTRH